MSSLPVVSFILWSTGLSIFALFGLVLKDWRAERRQSRMVFSQPARAPRGTVLSPVAANAANKMNADPLPLAKAA